MSKVTVVGKTAPVNSDQLQEKTANTKLDISNRVCVIITQKKNSSWVEDLDAREKLNKCKRVFH